MLAEHLKADNAMAILDEKNQRSQGLCADFYAGAIMRERV